MKRALQLIFVLALGGGAFYLVFRDVEWADFRQELARVDYALFSLGLLCFFGLHLARSIRWGCLIQGVKPEIRFRSYFSICSIGFFLINVLPFRLGEFVRPYLLLDKEEVPFGSGMATVLVERVLDVAALGVLFVGVLIWGVDHVSSVPVLVYGHEYDLVQLGRTTILAALVPFGGAIVVLVLLGERGVRLARRAGGLISARVGELMAGFLESFIHAVRSLGSVRQGLKVVAWSVAVWGVNVVSLWIMLRSFPFGAEMGLWDGATVLVCICLVLILPPPPGFAGVFEGAIAVALTQIYAQSVTSAAAFGVLVHLAQFALLAGLGLLFLWLDRVSLSTLLEGMKGLRASPPPASESPGESSG